MVGTARSGTSWLSETIAQQKRYRMLFEPEQETQTKRGYLLCDQWIDETNDSPRAHHYLKHVFANRVDCDWIAQNSNRKWKRHLWPLIPKKFVIKFVRCNLSAIYMNRVFEIPVIHLLRNPYDVISSQRKANFPWLTDFKIFASQPKLVALIQEKFKIDISNDLQFSKLELLALRWCIENIIPLQVLGGYPKGSSVIKYEDLVEDIQVFYDICSKFDIDYIDTIEKIYSKPSSKTNSQSSIITKRKEKISFTSEELLKIKAILDSFDNKLYPNEYVSK